MINKRGAVWRSREGGSQEREIANKYKKWRAEIALKHPRLSSALLDIEKSYRNQAELFDDQSEIDERMDN